MVTFRTESSGEVLYKIDVGKELLIGHYAVSSFKYVVEIAKVWDLYLGHGNSFPAFACIGEIE